MKITIDTVIKKGDEIERDGYKYVVISSLDDVIFFLEDEYGDMRGWSKKEMIKVGYSLQEKTWSPADLKEGDKYWFVDTQSGEADWWYFNSNDTDKLNIALGNCHETEAKALEWLKDKIK